MRNLPDSKNIDGKAGKRYRLAWKRALEEGCGEWMESSDYPELLRLVWAWNNLWGMDSHWIESV